MKVVVYSVGVMGLGSACSMVGTYLDGVSGASEDLLVFIVTNSG